MLRSEAHTPSRPALVRSPTAPTFRLRRYESAPVATKHAVLASPARPAAALSRSRSALTLGRAGSQRWLLETTSATVLPSNFRPRARSAPVLRYKSGPPPTAKPGALGESLRFSSCALLTAPAVNGPFVAAARMYFDPTTGRECALRAAR